MLAWSVVAVIALYVGAQHFSEKRKSARARAWALLEHEKRKYAQDLGVEILNETHYAVEVEVEGDLVIIKRIYKG